ncbi:MAG: hypothetical protein ACI4R8_02665 [Candidatus Caccovivens sp.]
MENVEAVFDEEFAQKFKEVCERRHAWYFYESTKKFLPFLHKIKNSVDRKKVDLPKVEFNIKDMKSMALVFFQDLRPEFYESIKRVLKASDTLLKENEPAKEHGLLSVGVKGNKEQPNEKPFIEINLNPENTSMGCVGVAHEFAHILSERVQKRIRPRTDCIGEIESLFVEKLYLDYMLGNGIISKEEYDNNKQMRLNSLLNNLDLMFEEEEILSRLGQDITKESFLKLDSDTKEHGNHDALIRRLDIMVNGQNGKKLFGQYVFRYIVGDVVSEALYQDYLKQPNETLNNFANYLEHNAKLNLKGSLQKLLGEEAENKIKNTWLAPREKN